MAEYMFYWTFVFIVLMLVATWYSWRWFRPFYSSGTQKFITILYWTASALAIFGLITIVTDFSRTVSQATFWRNVWTSYSLGMVIFMFLSSFTFLLMDLMRFFFKKEKPETVEVTIPSRRKFLANTTMTLASMPVWSMMYGTSVGKYRLIVKRVTLTYPDLPDSFDGFTITQFSDLHCGSIDSAEHMKHCVQLINEQQSDVIVFTGDMINVEPSEVEPYQNILNKLEAEHGVFSVTGNHDYLNYRKWDIIEGRDVYLNNLMQYQRAMGFQMLNNEHVHLQKGGERITLAGVENWGLPPFPQVGDLDKALAGSEAAPFTVLLSHDPTHWDAKVLPNDRRIHLTLSGHTHGGQLGVRWAGFQWSVMALRYPRWLGLYEEANQFLYVNAGIGCIGFPGRVGINPEITVFELRKGQEVVG